MLEYLKFSNCRECPPALRGPLQRGIASPKTDHLILVPVTPCRRDEGHDSPGEDDDDDELEFNDTSTLLGH